MDGCMFKVIYKALQDSRWMVVCSVVSVCLKHCINSRWMDVCSKLF